MENKERVSAWFLTMNGRERRDYTVMGRDGEVVHKTHTGQGSVYMFLGWKFLKSYDTVVGAIDPNGDVHRYWQGWQKSGSTTTYSHVLKLFGQDRAREWYDLYNSVEPLPTLEEVYGLPLVDRGYVRLG